MSLTCVSQSTISSIHIIKPVDFDEEIVPEVGDIGKYQAIRYLMLNFIAITVAVNWLADLVLSADIPHACALPNMDTYPYEEYFNNNTYQLLYPSQEDPIHICFMYEPKCYYDNRTNFSGCSVVGCELGHYFPSKYENPRITMVNQFGLVCEKKYLKRVSSLVFMAGVMVGAFVISYLSDKYGRRATMFSVIGLQVLFGFILAFMYSFLSFICMRFLLGTTTAGLYLVIFILGCELVGPKYRTYVGLGYEITFGLGYLVLAALGYFIHNWKHFQITVSLSSLVLFLYWKAIPESPRWLMVTGNMKKALEVIHKMAQENGVVLGRDLKSKFEVDDDFSRNGATNNNGGSVRDSQLTGFTAGTTALMSSDTSVLDLLRYPELRKRVLILSGIWLVLSMVYYSMSFMVDQFRGNLYINICISGLVEIPATLLALPMINRLGRKTPLIIFFLLSSVSLMLCVVIPSGWHFAITASAMSGKLFITAGFAIVYVYSAELYPTTLRNNGVGINSMFGRIGGILSPVALLLGELWWLNALFATLSILCLMASVGVLFLPETKNSPLPETVNKIEGNVDLSIPKNKKNVSFGSITNNVTGMYSHMLPSEVSQTSKNGTAPKAKFGSYHRMVVAKAPEASLYNISSSDNSEARDKDSHLAYDLKKESQPEKRYTTNVIYRLETTV